MIKLIVSDFDGTLLPYGNKRLSSNVVDRIKKYVDSGINFVVASGRTYSELKALMGELSDKVYFIADDGALVIKNDKVLFKKPFSQNSLKYFFDSNMFVDCAFYSMNSVFYTNKSPISNFGKRIVHVNRHFEIDEDVYKVSANIIGENVEINPSYRIHFSENDFAEFVTKYSNKGVALANLQLHLLANRFDTVAIGDAKNDIPMMNHSKCSISISDKCPELVSKCSFNFDTIEKAFDLMDEMQKQH